MIEVRNLAKSFGKVKALDDVSFRVERTAIFGMIGPNGAGKTTCLNILSTLLKPSSGEVFIDGLSLEDHVRETRRKIGYMPDFFGTYRNVTTWEYLDFYGGACGLRGRRRNKHIEDVLLLTQLEGKQTTLVDNLSRGMKQRLCLAKALLHEPRVLILDEPASGLDPRARREIREILKTVAHQGVTVLISSHILRELDDMCTHIGILEQGQLRRYGAMDDVLRAAKPHRTWRVAVLDNPERAAEIVRHSAGVAEVRVQDGVVLVQVPLETEDGMPPLPAFPPAALAALAEARVQVAGLTEDRASLEDAFLTFTNGLVS